MRRSTGSRRIEVGGVEYRWRATGDDGYIVIGVWPANEIGPYLTGTVRYHETWIDQGAGMFASAGDQIVITGRLVRRVIEHAIAEHRYDPNVPGKPLNVFALDGVIRWDDAVRAGDPEPPE